VTPTCSLVWWCSFSNIYLQLFQSDFTVSTRILPLVYVLYQ
jgi:hypothetical protein